MSLSAYKRSKEPGLQRPLDVRAFNIVPETEQEIPYPIPANIEREVPEETLLYWFEEYQRFVEKKNWRECIAMSFYLKLLFPGHVKSLIKSEHQVEMEHYLAESFNPNLDTLSQYNYLFPENSEKQKIHPEFIRGQLKISSALNDFSGLIKEAVAAHILFPEVFSSAVLEEYWPGLLVTYQRKKFKKLLFAIAGMRIVYPEHLAELEITKEQIESITYRGISAREDCEIYALLKILAQPEIPGLTTWPPKKDKEEPQLGDNTPKQPETLNL